VPAGHSRSAGLVAALFPQKPSFHLLCLPSPSHFLCCSLDSCSWRV
jgi:hypothetical protein